jgi:hypothetical protein
MATQEQKIEHLGDHLPYEVLMLRHTHNRMNSRIYPLDWNAFYEAFAVHARILLDFLENNSKSNGSNFNASDFSAAFKARRDTEIARIVRQEMNCQVLHFGKNRKSEPSAKVDLEKVNKVHAWVMDNFARFISQLDADLKKHWYPDRANLKKRGEVAQLLAIQNQTNSTL